MKFLHFVPHVNRPDLTVSALKSIPNLWPNTLLIDNSNDGSLASYVGEHMEFGFMLVRPPVPLNTAQTYNWMRFIAISEDTDFITFMHNDCEVITEGGDKLLIEKASEIFSNNTNKIGWIHHDANDHEDLFCAYKTDMLQEVGEWDWISFPFYYLDIDYMKRVRKLGWTIQKTSGIMCTHHRSSTIANDKFRNFANNYYMSLSSNMMNIKWSSKLDGDWSNL